MKDEGVLDVYYRFGKFEFCVLKSDLEERMVIDMYKVCFGILEYCRVLNVYGVVDEIVLLEDVYEFGKRIWNNFVYIIDGVDYNFKLW